MTAFSYVKPQPISLKAHPDINERWLQERIIEDPSILGLGELVVKDIEVRQPRAGRLDLLLVEPNTERWYEVEIQLGDTDASHIVRTIEYWDIQRKRYKQYDHCAVLVAENVTSRFLNVIGLFNGAIPIIAIQLSALQVDDKIALSFVKVLDEVVRGDEEKDDDRQPGLGADRAFWEKSSGAVMLPLVDRCFDLLREIRPGLNFRYNKHYIGQYEGGLPNHCVKFRPSKQWVRAAVRVKNKKPWISRLNETSIELMGEVRSPRLVLRLRNEDLEKNLPFIKELFVESCQGADEIDE